MRSSPGSRSRSGGRSHSASITSTQRHACICRCWTKGSPMPCGAAMQPGPTCNWIGRIHVLMAQPDPWIRVKAQRAFEPAPGRTRQEIMAAFRAYQVQYVDRLRQANGLDLARARVASPVVRWLPMPLGSAFRAANHSRASAPRAGATPLASAGVSARVRLTTFVGRHGPTRRIRATKRVIGSACRDSIHSSPAFV